MDWREEYRRKLVSADEAAAQIKSGDRVFLTFGEWASAIPGAIFSRRHELKDVRIYTTAAENDPGWYNPGAPESFKMAQICFSGELARASLDEGRSDFIPQPLSTQFKLYDERPKERKAIDVFIATVSPPDSHGFCSFGAYLWNKKAYAKRARKVLAEVNERVIRTRGDNFIHVSEIDHFVEHTPPLLYTTDEEIDTALASVEDAEYRKKLKFIVSNYIPPHMRGRVVPFLTQAKEGDIDLDFFGRTFGLAEPEEWVKRIAENVSTLIKDGDCIQVGIGAPGVYFAQLGIFNNKIDLGFHSEVMSRGIAKLVKAGVITGKYKTINIGRVVCTAATGADPEDLAIINDNPKFELYAADYVTNIKIVSANDNQVAMNNAICVDLTGNINAETVLGPRIWGGIGGQPELHIGAVLSRGGRAITLLRSTAMGGGVSRIVPYMDEGSAITIPRYFADYIVTEYGIARMYGKTFRERARELIAIAHPDFRADLTERANALGMI